MTRLMALIALALLPACQTLSPDGGMSLVETVATRELGKETAAVRSGEEALALRERVATLLKRPLTADAAVQIALFNNRGLQAAYNELGIAETAMVQASLPPAPRVSLSRVRTPIELDIERRIVGDILALATLPARAEIAANRFRQAQLRAAEETLRLAVEARRAWYSAVAARALANVLAQANASAAQAAELAARLGRTGAMNKLDQAREQVFHAELAAQLATARRRADSERERLIRLLGLWGDDLAFRIPDTLPVLPARPQSLPAIETEAVRRRVDIQIARIEVETLAKTYGLTNATRFINLLEVAGVSRTQREADGTGGRGGGVEIEFQIPIFDFGETRVRAAEQNYLQAVNRLSERAINARSQAREAYRGYRSGYDIARHYQREVLPLRKIISDETLLHYNAMQIDVFALLAEARQRIGASVAAIEAQRDFWIAATDLGAAISGGGMAEGREASRAAAPAAASSEH